MLVAVRDWKCNAVRIPLNQDRWFGRAPKQTGDGNSYRAWVRRSIDTITSLGAYAILDLHWNDCEVWGENIGQHKMPDANSLTFWKSCATEYRNHPGVIFDLYNEPHDVSWDVWRDGGDVTETDSRTGKQVAYKAVGMKAMLANLRAVGARNLVIVGGLDWSYDLSGFLNGYALSDPGGQGVVYANHAYPMKGDSVPKWVGKMEAATAKIPVIVSEFGANNRPEEPGKTNPWVVAVLDAIDKHDWSFTAWDLHPAAGPTLISDWNYTPTPSFGEPVKAYLAKIASQK